MGFVLSPRREEKKKKGNQVVRISFAIQQHFLAWRGRKKKERERERERERDQQSLVDPLLWRTTLSWCNGGLSGGPRLSSSHTAGHTLNYCVKWDSRHGMRASRGLSVLRSEVVAKEGSAAQERRWSPLCAIDEERRSQ